jgi:hypothetical protein
MVANASPSSVQSLRLCMLTYTYACIHAMTIESSILTSDRYGVQSSATPGGGTSTTELVQHAEIGGNPDNQPWCGYAIP